MAMSCAKSSAPNAAATIQIVEDEQDLATLVRTRLEREGFTPTPKLIAQRLDVREREVRAHIHAALNVGATRQEVAEVIFQQVTYGGMPVVVEALRVFKEVLEDRGEWE